MDTHAELETKSGIPLDAVVTHADMMRAFEAFKETNDQRIALTEKKSGDVLVDEKLARINTTLDAQARRLDDIALKGSRPALGGDRHAVRSQSAIEHKAAFEAYVRSGEAGGLRALEVKALTVGSNPDGGYLGPPEVETQIGEGLKNISPIRGIAGVRTISGNVYKKPFMTAGPAVGWVGETDVCTQTASPTLDELSFPAMELYAMPASTATLLEDSAVNIDQWLAQDAIRDPQVQGLDRQLPVATAGAGGRPGVADDLRGDRGRGHAGHRRQLAVDRLRRLQPRLSGGRPRRRLGAARSLHRQTLRAVLHDQARRLRRAGLRRHQADEVRSQLMTGPGSPGHAGRPAQVLISVL